MNVEEGDGSSARIVMRAKGVFRVLLNARIWPGMKFVKMDNNKGVTFTCVNTALGGSAMSTFAVKMPSKDDRPLLDELLKAVTPFCNSNNKGGNNDE